MPTGRTIVEPIVGEVEQQPEIFVGPERELCVNVRIISRYRDMPIGAQRQFKLRALDPRVAAVARDRNLIGHRRDVLGNLIAGDLGRIERKVGDQLPVEEAVFAADFESLVVFGIERREARSNPLIAVESARLLPFGIDSVEQMVGSRFEAQRESRGELFECFADDARRRHRRPGVEGEGGLSDLFSGVAAFCTQRQRVGDVEGRRSKYGLVANVEIVDVARKWQVSCRDRYRVENPARRNCGTLRDNARIGVGLKQCDCVGGQHARIAGVIALIEIIAAQEQLHPIARIGEPNLLRPILGLERVRVHEIEELVGHRAEAQGARRDGRCGCRALRDDRQLRGEKAVADIIGVDLVGTETLVIAGERGQRERFAEIIIRAERRVDGTHFEPDIFGIDERLAIVREYRLWLDHAAEIAAPSRINIAVIGEAVAGIGIGREDRRLPVIGIVDIAAQRRSKWPAIIVLNQRIARIGALFAEAGSVERVAEFALVIENTAAERDADAFRDRAANIGGQLVPVILRDIGLDAAFPLVAGALRNEVDRTRIGVAAIERRLRTFDDLKPLDRIDVVIGERSRIINTVDEIGDPRLAENIGLAADHRTVGIAPEAVVEDEAGGGLGDVGKAIKAETVDRRGGGDGDGGRRVLQTFLGLARGDDDVVVRNPAFVRRRFLCVNRNRRQRGQCEC